MRMRKIFGYKIFGFTVWQLLCIFLLLIAILCPILHRTHYYLARRLVLYILFPSSCIICVIALLRENLLITTTSKLLVAIPIWLGVSFFICCFVRKDLSLIPYGSPMDEEYRIGVTFKDAYVYYSACASSILLPFLFGILLPKEKRKRCLMIVFWFWAVFMAGYAGVCILKSFTDSGMMAGGSLSALYNPNNLAAVLLPGVSISFYLLLLEQRWYLRILLSFMIVVLMITIILTNCMTVLIATIPPLFMFTFFLISEKGMKNRIRSRSLRVAIGVLIAALLCVVPYLMEKPIKNVFNNIVTSLPENTNRQLLFQNNSDAVQLIIEATDGEKNNYSSRTELWKQCLERFIHRPKDMLFGTSPLYKEQFYHTIDSGFTYGHVHNGFLGILLCYGIIGFLLFISFLFALCINSIHLFFNRHVPLYQRFLPVLLLPPLINNLMEEMFFTREYLQPPTIMLMLVSGFVILYSEELRMT